MKWKKVQNIQLSRLVLGTNSKIKSLEQNLATKVVIVLSYNLTQYHVNGGEF